MKQYIHTFTATGYTDDVLEYIRVSVPKNMLADLKDSIKQGRSLNVQDKYGATAVSDTHTHIHTLMMCMHACIHMHTQKSQKSSTILAFATTSIQ